MAIDPNRRRFAINYEADDGVIYQYVTSRNHAAAVNAQFPTPGTPAFPVRWKPRMLHGVQTLNGRDRKISIVIPSKNSPYWLTGDTITVDPWGAFRITGRTGERRTQGAAAFDGNANPPGERVLIGYLGDDGHAYFLQTSRNHAAAVGAQPPVAGAVPFPKVWTPRHYNCISSDLNGADQKVQLIEPLPTAGAWVQDISFDFIVSGLGTFHSTGRTAEKRPNGAPPYDGT